MSVNGNKSDVVFFLGAGASVEAGVPDTYSFVQEFIDSLSDNKTKKETVIKIVEILSDWKQSSVDIELLLETLTKLQNRNDEPLLKFYYQSRFLLREYSKKEPLIKDLKDFIKKRAIVLEPNIAYLEPLSGFVEEGHPLSIISLNYDTAIEQFSIVHKFKCEDGFSVRWEPELFKNIHNDINLYKMHGSVMWYQSDRGDHIKVPINTEYSSITLITGEKAENLMMYPMQKQDYAEPLLELSVKVKQLLESEQCRFLIVVGYSFRDEHIKRMIWDAARRNKKMRLIVIDPNAHDIYFKKLKYYNEQTKVESSLFGKVICLPYTFKNCLRLLRNGILRELKQGLNKYEDYHRMELQGENPTWLESMDHLSKAEYVEHVLYLKSKVEYADTYSEFKVLLSMYLKVGCNLLISDATVNEGKTYLESFYALLKNMIVEKFSVRKDNSSPFIQLFYNDQPFPNNHKLFDPLSFSRDFLEICIFLNSRLPMVTNRKKELKAIFDWLMLIHKYLAEIGEINQIQNYLNLRRANIIIPDHLIAYYLNSDYYERMKTSDSEAKQIIVATEKRITEKLFSSYEKLFN